MDAVWRAVQERAEKARGWDDSLFADLADDEVDEAVARGLGVAAGLEPDQAVGEWRRWRADPAGHYRELMVASGADPELADRWTAEAVSALPEDAGGRPFWDDPQEE